MILLFQATNTLKEYPDLSFEGKPVLLLITLLRY